MKPHIDRMYEERADLRAKILAAVGVVTGVDGDKLTQTELFDLESQIQHMLMYSAVLTRRIRENVS